MILAYKGFQIGLICLGYHFVMGLNVTDKANCRANGFHCAANPLDCLSYYPDMKNSEYYIVEAGGDIDEDNDDSKIACTHLTILKKLSRIEFFVHALAYMVDHPKMQANQRVSRDLGEAKNGYAIVRGVDPVACGKTGDILALAKEDPFTSHIVQIAVAEVDDKKVQSNTWYDIDFTVKGGIGR